jgi:hypothetical protein
MDTCGDEFGVCLEQGHVSGLEQDHLRLQDGDPALESGDLEGEQV